MQINGRMAKASNNPERALSMDRSNFYNRFQSLTGFKQPTVAVAVFILRVSLSSKIP